MAINLPPQGTRMWLICGISNARGFGAVKDAQYATYNQHATRIYSLNQWNRWKYAVDPLIGRGGTYAALAHDNDGGVGFGITLANKLIDARPSHRIGLVNSAKGGRYLDYFMPSADYGSAWAAIVARARKAQAFGPIQGMVFYGTETDTDTAELVDTWVTRFKTFVDELRTALGVSFPVFLCAIGDHTGMYAIEPRHSQWLALHDAQMAISHSMVHPISTRGLALQDPAHLATKGQVILGRTIAFTYRALYQ